MGWVWLDCVSYSRPHCDGYEEGFKEDFCDVNFCNEMKQPCSGVTLLTPDTNGCSALCTENRKYRNDTFLCFRTIERACVSLVTRTHVRGLSRIFAHSAKGSSTRGFAQHWSTGHAQKWSRFFAECAETAQRLIHIRMLIRGILILGCPFWHQLDH